MVSWVSATRCNAGSCLEVGWRRACSGASACIEVHPGVEMVGIRDTKEPGPELWFTAAVFASFVDALKADQLTT